MVTPSVVNVTDEPSGSHRHHENGFELAEETAENVSFLIFWLTFGVSVNRYCA